MRTKRVSGLRPTAAPRAARRGARACFAICATALRGGLSIPAGRLRLTRFSRDESGSLLVWGMITLTMVLLLVGVSLDVSRFETTRTRAQSTLDRAVLAAADLSETRDAQTVVDDYFDKAGLSNLQPTAQSEGGDYNEWKRVTGSLDLDVDTWFMKAVGVNQLQSIPAAAAEEAIGTVEISLVLDVSGSMVSSSNKIYDSTTKTYKTRLEMLRPAAQEFVQTMFTNVSGAGTEEGKLLISVVPYAEQVNIGNDLATYLNVSTEHTKAACVDFTESDFSTVAISDSTSLPRTAYADVRPSNYHPSSTTSPYLRECWGYDTTPTSAVLAFSDDEDALTTMIGDLTAEGDTAIDIGAKWGLALLDPAMRDVVSERIDDGKVSTAMADHPLDYNDTDLLKIMVLMTDGENTNTYRLKDPYRSGSSPIVKQDGYYYYYKSNRSSTSKFMCASTSGCKVTTTTTDSKGKTTTTTTSVNFGSWTALSSSYTTLTWPAVWEIWNVDSFSTKIYAKAESAGSSTLFDAAVEHTGNTAKDSRLSEVCQLARDNGVLVFAIAFNAGTNGQTALQDCVTADAYYYDAVGTDIEDAFAGIANSINMLRLTQ